MAGIRGLKKVPILKQIGNWQVALAPFGENPSTH